MVGATLLTVTWNVACAESAGLVPSPPSVPRTVTAPVRDAKGNPSYRTACYPSLAEADGGTVLAVWWETGPFGSRIGYARFNRACLEGGGDRAGGSDKGKRP